MRTQKARQARIPPRIGVECALYERLEIGTHRAAHRFRRVRTTARRGRVLSRLALVRAGPIALLFAMIAAMARPTDGGEPVQILAEERAPLRAPLRAPFRAPS